MRSSTPSSRIQPVEAPVLARRLSWWRGGFATGLVVVGGVVVVGRVVVVVEVGGDVVVRVDVDVDVDVGGVVVDEDVVELGDVVVSVHVVVVVDGLVQVDGFVDVGGSSPLGEGVLHPGRSFGHHAAAHTRPSPEAEASGAAPCRATNVNTAPAVSTPI
ncbi:hypothetical protein [Lentzea indica]|uniref:hypothetical protein n=1 Tax=Lentzea indica TaxID=2604800 RepID=UPI0014391F0D|nr:hypothetical protein [Lentzea indica]